MQPVPWVGYVAQAPASTLTVTFPLWAPDQYDSLELTDWGSWGSPGWPTEDEPDSWDVDGDVVVEVTGTGLWLVKVYRMQGNSPNPWRTGTFSAQTPLQDRSFAVGRGPTPKTMGDLPQVSAAWSSS